MSPAVEAIRDLAQDTDSTAWPAPFSTCLRRFP